MYRLSIIKIIAIAVAFCLALGLAFISLLGENKKIEELVTNYVVDIKEQKYVEAYQYLSKISKVDRFADISRFSDFNFLIELSLLQKYNLIDSDDYTIKLKKSHLWIPYITKDKIYVSVFLKEKKTNNSISSFFKKGKKEAFVENFFVVGRENGTWKIIDINIHDSLISKLFKETEVSFNLKNFLKLTQNKIILNKLEINTKNISPLEKRMCKYILKKTSDLIGNISNIPEKTGAGLTF